MRFGPGSQLAAQCTPVAPPSGWRPWTPDLDGPLPPALAAHVNDLALADDAQVPLGTTETFPLPGVTALIRVEPRLWQNGEPGCFRAGAVYLPAFTTETVVAPTAKDRTKLEVTIAVLTVASLTVGTIATLSSLSRRRKARRAA